MDNDIKYWVAFSKINDIGPQKFKNLYNHFPNMQNAWQANYTDLKRVGFYPKEVEKILAARNIIDPDREYGKLVNLGIDVITIHDDNYPKLLKEIYSPPALLYIKGNQECLSEPSLSVVGTRKTTQYGRHVTPELVRQFSNAGLTIVSGIALGIDTLAHQAALDAHGNTIAVMACGLDLIYPATNRKLAENIINNNGILISEYPLGTPPLRQHFPVRNRIISGLSRGVVVIEGNKDSGSLITAKCALEQNREIFAVPGNISSETARGPNKLIKLGATVVTSANDVLETLKLDYIQKTIQNKKILPNTKEEAQLVAILSLEPVHIDELVQKSKLNTSTINSVLTMMEMKGIVKHVGGMQYVLADEL